MPLFLLKNLPRPHCWTVVWLALLIAPVANAQEKPYFVTYSHDLEEPGNLEIETKTALARPDGSFRYGAAALEMEYGVRGSLLPRASCINASTR